MSTLKSTRATLAACVVGAFALAPAATAADIVIVQGEGFDDPTPVEPIGGNPGTTLGEQRLIAFELAASLWGAILESDVEIVVSATFTSLNCDPGSAVLGNAAPSTVEADFPNAPVADTWYFSALANALAGVDLNPGEVDIIINMNGDIDNNPDCLINSNWYYGLDNNATGNDSDIVNVVMHELAHGLGSASVLNAADGTLPADRPDIYTRFAFDTDLQLFYSDMTDEQRAGSVVNTGNVVWDGPAVNALAAEFLQPALIGELEPAALGSIMLSQAFYGPAVSRDGLFGTVVLVDDGTDTFTDGCQPYTAESAAAVNGNIALIDRGGCAFTTKSVNAQAAGARAAIVANNVSPGLPPLGGVDDSLVIPTTGISLEDRETIAAALPGVTINLNFDPTQLAGANEDLLVRLFVPEELRVGSTFSHWDTTANPNLLMEPSFTTTLETLVSVDLSAPLFADIGWSLVDIDNDFVPDINDNCTVVANGSQRDTDHDGFGNICDADLNNDGIVNVVDLGLLRTRFFSTDEDADFNDDGVVNVDDLGILRAAFFGTPGPSGVSF
ncbi:MAG: PA domain-containing protein [Gammaproteobacteria bacterium]